MGLGEGVRGVRGDWHTYPPAGALWHMRPRARKCAAAGGGTYCSAIMSHVYVRNFRRRVVQVAGRVW